MSSDVSCPLCFEPFANPLILDVHLQASHARTAETSAISSFFTNTKKLFSQTVTPALQDLAATALTGEKNNTFELNRNEPGIQLNGLDDEQFERFARLDATQKEELGDWIRKDHHATSARECGLERCGRLLGLANGKVSCFRCGKQVCLAHGKFQMKLSVDARHDPINGIWARVCEWCYEGRKGYAQTPGVSRNRTNGFMQKRAEAVAQTQMEVNKMEKRLQKIKASIHEFKSSTLLTTRASVLFGSSAPVLPVVKWVPDSDATTCSACERDFSFLVRRHHCRLCGVVICAVNCSTLVPVGRDDTVRVCPKCVYLLGLGKAKLAHQEVVPITVLYKSFLRFKSSISHLLTSFNALLLPLRLRPIILATDQDFNLCLRLRKELLDAFAAVDALAKQIRALEAEGAVRRVNEAVFLGIITYEQSHMFTLQMMPAVTKLGGVEGEGQPGTEEREEVRVLEEAVESLEAMLKDSMARRRLEDVESIRMQIVEMREELGRKRAGLE